jgi:hypothetical protein
MGRFLLPLLLIAFGIYGLAHEAAISEKLVELVSMYPPDLAHQTALRRCFEEDRNFNRSSATARAACYRKYLRPDPDL